MCEGEEHCGGGASFLFPYQTTAGTLARETIHIQSFEIRLKNERHKFHWVKTSPFTNKPGLQR